MDCIVAKKNLILLIFITLAYLANAEEPKRISMAIMEFRTDNTKESYGKACLDMLSEGLFNTGLFTMMEKSQMDRIARQHGFKEFDTIDSAQVARLGRILNVDKIVLGSIIYIDSYIIDVKVLNSSTGEIEFTTRRKITRTDKLNETIQIMAVAIERHYLGYYNLSGSPDITIEACYLQPFYLFHDVVNSGTGLQAIIQFNFPFDSPICIQGITGYYIFNPARDSLEYFCMLPAYLCASYKFRLARNLDFIPAAGAGYIFSVISSDGSVESDGLYWQEGKNLYYNISIVSRAELDILLYDRWYLVILSQYNLFFEKTTAGQFFTAGVGLKMLF
jgi:hypothetical protein